MSATAAKRADAAPRIQGVEIPDSRLCRQITELVRDTESDLLFHHSSRVWCFAALTGLRRGLPFDRELLYAGAMFHDMGLTRQHGSRTAAGRSMFARPRSAR
jgi:HD superfamily phosphodiesterase